MILLCGPLSDQVLSHFAGYLFSEGIDFVFLDQRHFGREIQLPWAIEGASVKGFLDYGRWRLGLEYISGVFVRWDMEMEDSDARLGATKEERRTSEYRLYQHLAILLETLSCAVINRPSSTLSNKSKPYQLGLIREWGFDVPRTIVTNDPTQAKKFYRELGGSVIVKSLSYARSVVRKLLESDLSRIESVAACPIQLQELISGTNVRVHVIGQKVFAVEIHTDAIDYRYAEEMGFNCDVNPTEVPTEIAERCIGLTSSLGLEFAGIDLYRLPDGRWGCFEVNASPAFTWFEHKGHQMICPTLADHLMG